MAVQKLKWLKTSLVSILIAFSSPAYSGESLRKTGDILQFASPISACMMAAYDNKSIHFVTNYLQVMGVVGIGKWSGKRLKYELAQRPDKTAYTGMPSGHTASVWLPASYMRHFGGRPVVAYVLYSAAALTAYSRVASKRHTIIQVIASIGLSEVITAINHKYLQCLYIDDNEVGIILRI